MNIVEAAASELAQKLSFSQVSIDELDNQIKKLQAQKKKLTGDLDGFKNELREAMSDNGITRIEAEGILFRLDKPSVLVDIQDEEQIPDKFFRVKREADKTAIKKALQVGDDVPGASLKEGKNRLTIKVD